MTDECIHGFERELCDICAPRKREGVADGMPSAAARAVTTRRRPSTRKPESLRSTPALARDSAANAVNAQSALAPVLEFGEQRVFHVTHGSNLAGILEAGEIRARATAAVDVSSPERREQRAAAIVPSGASVADHVPFSLSPHSTSWDDLRGGAEGADWSDAARTSKGTDYIVLVVPVSALADDLVVTESDATTTGVRSGTGVDEAAPLVRRFTLADPDLLEPEVLVPGAVPFDAVTLVGVPNDRARDRVKAAIAEAGGHAPRVAVYPPWFRPSEVVTEA